MILSKRYPLLVSICFLYLFGLLITQKYTQNSFEARLRDEANKEEAIQEKDHVREQKSLKGSVNERRVTEERVIPPMEGYQNSKLNRLSRRNVHWSENGRKLLFDLSKNRVENIRYFHRQRYPLPPEDAVLNIAWFSLRTFMQKIRYPVMYPNCDTGKVILTKADKDITKIREADVVLFAGGFDDEKLWRQLRDGRDPNQIWLFVTDESPLTAKSYIPPYHLRDITFNVTFTYRSNADISVSYGYYGTNESMSAIPRGRSVNFHQRNPRLAAWMSSHCDTIAWNRTGFIWDLSRYIAIDKYGSCGNLHCGTVKRYQEGVFVNNECKKTLRQYKFHFALENSCCTEYISEKFWNILRHYDAIPVVVGAPKEDYERIAPPNSFIYAADFETMEELAEYMKRVATDSELFNSFFQWKYEGYVRGIHEKQRRIGYEAANCRILEYLQKPNTTQGRHDLYGPAWMGGCSECGDKSILRDYSQSGYDYVQN